VAVRFTPSPRYQDDNTVFASSYNSSGECSSGTCEWLYKSTDRGHTWTVISDDATAYGEILLPPAYPDDSRLFSVGDVVSVSTDGGRTFTKLGAAWGPAEMSPGFSSGDPRIVLGATPTMASPLAMQYVDGMGLEPFVAPLPKSALPVQFSYSPRFGPDERLLVETVDAPEVAVSTAKGVPVAAAALRTSHVYSCSISACERVIDLGLDAPARVAWTGADSVVVAGMWHVYRSVDGGRTFTAGAVPGDGRSLSEVRAGPDGSVLATAGDSGEIRLYRSDDKGLSWRVAQGDIPALSGLTVLPDGRLLGWLMETRGLTCSVDGGRTWAPACPAP
jgi:hypothetical protein